MSHRGHPDSCSVTEDWEDVVVVAETAGDGPQVLARLSSSGWKPSRVSGVVSGPRVCASVRAGRCVWVSFSLPTRYH